MPTVVLDDDPVRSTRLVTIVAIMLLTSACGSSSRIETFTAPSGSRCAVQVTADTASFPAAGGSGSLRVAASRDCQWAARTDAPWLTMVQPNQGQGDGSVRFSVGANADPASRSTSLTINDQHLDISQAGKPCELSVSSNHESVDGAGGDLSVSIRASADGCQWTAASTLSWITITSGREGRGTGVVTLHVEPVTGPPRSGTVTVAGQTVQVDQGTGCSYSIGTDSFSVDAAGGDRQVAVTAPSSCTWTAESRATWITITSGANASGSGTVTFHVAASDQAGRTGTMIVAGRTVTVTQSLGCTYSIAPSTVNVSAQAANIVIQVESGAGCGWTASSAVPWITIATGAGSGPGQVQVAIAANDGPARSGTITIAGRLFTVSQASGCAYTIAPPSQAVGGTGGIVTVAVTTGAGCTWTSTSNVEWITASPGGSGAGQTSLNVKANASPPRTGTVTIAGRQFTVSQASQCAWSFAPPSHDLPSSGGTGNVLVLVSGACSWTAAPNVSWIRITAGESGIGGGLLQFIVSANSGTARTGLIAIGGENYVVHQGGTGDIR